MDNFNGNDIVTRYAMLEIRSHNFVCVFFTRREELISLSCNATAALFRIEMPGLFDVTCGRGKGDKCGFACG